MMKFNTEVKYPRCANCQFGEVYLDNESLSRCHLNPPPFREVHPEDWCGQWELNEELCSVLPMSKIIINRGDERFFDENENYIPNHPRASYFDEELKPTPEDAIKEPGINYAFETWGTGESHRW